LTKDTAWLADAKNKDCSELMVKFDELTAAGLSPVNWQVGSYMTDYFYKGSIEYD
jgi:hypothetical protein